MMQRLRKIKAALHERLPASRLEPLTPEELKALTKRVENVPDHLLKFFEVIGCGTIGDSRYMLYDLLSPKGIFDDQTAGELDGVLLVGDDFAGRHEAYDTRAKWQFGSVGGAGRFRPHTGYETIIDFIEDWYASPE